MTKFEAIRAINGLSYGTMAVLTGKHTYAELDSITGEWFNAILNAPEHAFKACETWVDVYNTITT